MMQIYRVAIREYLENVKTKGFWIGIFIFPVLIWMMIEIPKFLEEKGIPTRHVVIIDRSDGLGEIARERITLLNRKKVLTALQTHIAEATASQREEMMKDQNIDIGELLDQLEQGLDQLQRSDVEINPFDPTKLVEMGDLVPEEMLLNDGQWNILKKMVLNQLPEDAPPFEEPTPRFQEVALPPDISMSQTDQQIEEQLKGYLRGDQPYSTENGDVQLFAMVTIPARALEPGEDVRFWSSNLADTDLLDAILGALTEEAREREYARQGIESEAVAEIASLKVRSVNFDPNKSEGEEKVGIRDKIRQYAPIGFVYMLWVAIFSIAQMLLNNTIEEKSNRIIEVLLSSVTTNELLLGKVLGVAAVGVTMQIAWIGSLISILHLKAGPSATWVADIIAAVITPELLVGFVFYFIAGYFFYAFLFAGIGSICNTIKEAQNFMSPLMLLMMVPLATMTFIPSEPNGTIATTLSWIPPWTPFVMMNRMAANPPAVEVYGTALVLLVSVIFVFWASAKVFRIGVLRTGQPPKLFELLGWLKSERP
ncbi:MAG: ABC transporter permease [Planctomycetota bacterium]|nr:ABC transporter permease [Planctomycetota bacterium]